MGSLKLIIMQMILKQNKTVVKCDMRTFRLYSTWSCLKRMLLKLLFNLNHTGKTVRYQA